MAGTGGMQHRGYERRVSVRRKRQAKGFATFEMQKLGWSFPSLSTVARYEVLVIIEGKIVS